MNLFFMDAHMHFDLYRNLEEDLEPIMEKLFNVSKIATDKLADPYADSKSRAALFSIIMQEAGQLYANAWHTESKRVKAVMDAYPKDKLEKVLEKYKSTGGLPLTKIEHDFDKYFDKMIIITDKLINSNKSGIDKKLKTVPGILKSKTKIETGICKVTYDDQKIKIEDILKIIVEKGYAAKLKSS